MVRVHLRPLRITHQGNHRYIANAIKLGAKVQSLPHPPRAVSSVGQSAYLTCMRSQVQVLYRPPRSENLTAFGNQVFCFRKRLSNFHYGAHMKNIYEDEDLLVIDKPAGLNADDFKKRVHRLDKDTSGVFLIAKNSKSLEFFQKQFKERAVKKKYLALVTGNLKSKEGVIENLLGRSPKDRRKQKIFLPQGPKAEGKRKAITRYKVLQSFKNYDLIEAEPQTGRKHQIRAQFAYLGHPIAGDKLYGFKNQFSPKELNRQFLHASFLKIKFPNGQERIFRSELAKDLKNILNNLK
jgi:23S rRNA-/tRNA-specific pseudouridylate synthase